MAEGVVSILVHPDATGDVAALLIVRNKSISVPLTNNTFHRVADARTRIYFLKSSFLWRFHIKAIL